MNRIHEYIARMPEEIDAMLVISPVNRLYFTGLQSTAGTLLMVRGAEGYFVIDFRYIAAAQAAVKDCEVILEEKLYGQIGELLARHGAKRLGVECDYMTLATYRTWQEKLSGVELVELKAAGQLIHDMRLIKSSEEIASICAAQKITEDAFTHILGYIRAGRTEREIACELRDFAGRHGSEKPSFDYIVVSGENSARPHGVPGDKPVAPGEFITMDFGCTVDGYCSDMTRTVVLGQPTDKMRLVYDTVLKAQLAGLAAVKAGVSCKEVDAAARNLIYAAGFEGRFGHGTGHSLGIEIHESPAFNMKDTTICTAGIVMTVEPGIYIDGEFGVRIEDMVQVTETGSINLTHADKSLILLP